MVIQALIEAIAPQLSAEMRREVVEFAVSAMRQTRDAYREPVSLLDIAVTDDRILRLTVRALYTHNTSTFSYTLGALPA